ncbi:MAG: hypothetical protein AMJ88_01160 [Anaerolineae bacterium SM23_ 63]|nr:MAG: hypothetical protein AMJ88_01160 [Anaerolineae bacterium SM23_ 63]
MKERLAAYGGQAVIEGVMMRGAQVCAVAVRSPDQSIVIETQPLSGMYRSRITKIPFLRGFLTLWDALVLGMRALTYSANMQVDEDEQLEGGQMILTLILSLTLGICLFFLLPAGVAHLVERFVRWGAFWSNLLEGLIRLILLVGYIWAIGFLPDIKRVYGYHGAEHKTISAFEAGAELGVDTVKQFPREHPRCGTAFLLTVIAFSILIFTAIGPQPLLQRLASRVLLVPVLISLAYEYIRLTGKLMRFSWARPLVLPNLWLQRLTTREPDPQMIEVAIAAFNSMRLQEEKADISHDLSLPTAT